MATPSTPAQPGLPEIWQELRALRQELAELRHQLDGRVIAAVAPQEAVPGDAPVAALETPLRQASAATLLARRNGERLQQELRRRLATAALEDGAEPGDDTEVDLLIDRLHDLADASAPGP